MRTRINVTYTAGTRSIDTAITDLTIEDIRLIVNETQKKVLCSSMQKDLITSVTNGVVTYVSTNPALAQGDKITFEIDKGDDYPSAVGVLSEIASGKQAIASAINAKGGEASATESFNELAQDIQDTPTSGVLSGGIVQSEPFSFMDYVCKQGAYPFTEIDDDSVTVINKSNSFSGQVQLLKVRMTALGTISGGYTFNGCYSLQNVTMPNLTTISGTNTFAGCSALQSATMNALTTISGNNLFYQCTALQSVTMNALTTISGNFVFEECTALQSVEFGTLITIAQPPLYDAKPNLRNITIGQDTDINLPFQQWSSTNVIAEGQSGIDELNTNLQINLISKLYQGGGKILRLGADLYDVTTQETRDMVTAKGWTLQRG